MSSFHFSVLDGTIVAAYLAVSVALGFWFGRKETKTSDSFFLADREATWPLVGTSLFCANISSQQFVGQAGLAYAIGLAAGAFQLVGSMCFVFLAVFFVDVYLSLGLKTSPEFYERRYSPGTRRYIAGINILLIVLANITASLYVGATVICSLFGWSASWEFRLAVAIIGAAAGAYTIFGGLRSVLWTDLFQAALLIGGGAVTLAVGLARAGGWRAVLGTYAPGGGNLWSIVLPWDHAFGWVAMATGAFVLGVHAHCTDQDYVQRVLAARSVFHAKMGAVFGAFLKIAALFVVAAPGVVAAKLIPGLANPDQAYTEMVVRYVPTGLSGLVLASLLAAILGSVSASLSASSSMVLYDFVAKARPNLSERARVYWGRSAMLGILVGCILVAPAIRGSAGVYAYLIRVGSNLAPPVFVCAVMGIFSRRADRRGAIATLVTGTVISLGSIVLLGDPAALARLPRYFQGSMNLAACNTLVCVGVMMAFSRGANEASSRILRTPSAAYGPMTVRERRIYRATLGLLLGLWLAVVLAFSPLGFARPRALLPKNPPAALP